MSSSLKKEVDKCLHEHGSSAEVRVGYGLTEASAATCLTPTGRYKEGSIGIPFPDTYYKIVAIGSHEEVPFGVDGEICISGPTVMLGYLNSPKETVKALRKHDDGKVWLHTGDIGCMDEEGYVFFKQRLKRVIISNGYNLYPTYIENIINSYDKVLTSTVIGVHHPKKVQVAKAYIVLKDGIKPTKDVLKSIKKHCEKNLATYSLPSEYEFMSSLPKTLVGKVAYTKLEKSEKENKIEVEEQKPVETEKEKKKRLKRERKEALKKEKLERKLLKKAEKEKRKEEKKKLKLEKKSHKNDK